MRKPLKGSPRASTSRLPQKGAGKLGLADLYAFLRKHHRIALDTSVFIYQANPKYANFADEVFAWIERPGHEAVTSTVTMAELMVRPYQELSAARISEIFGWYSTVPNLRWIAPDLNVADEAAELRARYRLKTPDALQAATAILAAATGLLSNDAIFRRIPGFETLLFDELI